MEAIRSSETSVLIRATWCHLPQDDNHQQNAALRQFKPQAQSPFWLLKLAYEHMHTRLLSTLSWSWTVLPPSDT
jgi:hypothetical protein